MRYGKLVVVVCMLLCLPALHAQRGRRGGGPTGAMTAPPMPVIVSIRGTLKQLDKKLIVLEADDTRTYMIRRSKKTAFVSGEKKIQPKDIDIESRITVEMMEDSDLKLTAITLRLDADQPPRPPRTR